MACARPWNYFLMGKQAKASADAAYVACQEQRTARIEARQERRVGVAAETGTTSGQILAGAVGDVLDTAASVGAGLFGGAGAQVFPPSSVAAPVSEPVSAPNNSGGLVEWVKTSPVAHVGGGALMAVLILRVLR